MHTTAHPPHACEAIDIQAENRMSKTRFASPPGPKGRRLVGNSYDYDRDRIGFLKRSLAEYGDVFTFSESTIFVNNPVLVQDLFNRTNTDFIAEWAIFADGQDSARLDQSVDVWMKSRKIGFPAMSRAVIRAHGARLARDFDVAIEGPAARAST